MLTTVRRTSRISVGQRIQGSTGLERPKGWKSIGKLAAPLKKQCRRYRTEVSCPISAVACTGWGRRVRGRGADLGDFAASRQPVRPGVPHREALAYISAACLLSAGLAIQWRRSARVGFLVPAVLYFIFAVLWLPRVVGYPQLFGTWGGMPEEMSPAAAMVPKWLPPGQTFWALATGVAHLLAGPAVLAGVMAPSPPGCSPLCPSASARRRGCPFARRRSPLLSYL